MGFFGRLFGKRKKPDEVAPPAAAPESQPAAPQSGESKSAEPIRIYDAYGRQFELTRQQWRDDILLRNLESVRNDPEQLSSMLVTALNDGFANEILPFAEHLQRIDSVAVRGATLLGVVYLQLNRLKDAERVLGHYTTRHGEDGYILTNLAKVFAARGEQAKAERTLWRGLELDPNQENGLLWFEVIAREKSGAEAGLRALEKVAALPSSWRAQLWLARAALERKDLAAARTLYEHALAKCPRPVPGDLLMQLTGDLGNHGQLVELLKLANPHFDAALHGLQVGNNLIKANLDLGRLDHARALVDGLYALKRPDFQQTLSYWDTEIAKARTTARGEIAVPIRLAMLTVRGPIWLDDSPLTAPFAEAKSDDASVLCFLGGSVDKSETEEPRLQLEDLAGRISRALPVFLSEQAHERTNTAAHVLQPYLPGAGFVLSGQPWDADAGADQSRQLEPAADYVVISHIESEAGAASIRLVRTIDGEVLDTVSAPLDLEHPEAGFRALADQLVSSLCEHTDLDLVDQPKWYDLPRGADFDDYQLRLEQALAVKLAGVDVAGRDALSGEREIITGNLHLCLRLPTSVTTRVLLVRTLEFMKIAAPPVVSEFPEKVRLLQKDHPLPEPYQNLIHRALDSIFAAESDEAL